MNLTWTKYQHEVFFNAPKVARIILFPSGRRTGKTLGLIQAFLTYLLKDLGPGLFIDVSATNISNYLQRYLHPILRQLPPDYYKYDGFLRRLSIKSHSNPHNFIEFRSALRPELIEGNGYRFIMVNEAGIIFRRGEYLYNNVIKPSLIDYPDSRLILAGTPKGANSLYHDLHLKAERSVPGYYTKQISSYENPFFTRRQIDDATSEIDEVMRQQEIYAQFISNSDVFVDYKDIRYIDSIPRTQLTRVVAGVDLAVSDSDSADYTAVCVLGIDIENRIYILDLQRGKFKFNEILAFIDRVVKPHLPDIIGVESVAAQEYIAQELRRVSKYYIQSVKVKNDKSYRFMPVAGKYKSGLVYHTKRVNPSFIKELTTFPVTEHDDQVDSLSIAYECLLGMDTSYKNMHVNNLR